MRGSLPLILEETGAESIETPFLLHQQRRLRSGDVRHCMKQDVNDADVCHGISRGHSGLMGGYGFLKPEE